MTRVVLILLLAFGLQVDGAKASVQANNQLSTLQFDLVGTAGLSPEEHAQLSEILSGARERLPALVAQRLNHRVQVRVVSLPGRTQGDETVAGFVDRRRRITLNRDLLSQTHTMIGTLLHEIGHVYDYASIDFGAGFELKSFCAPMEIFETSGLSADESRLCENQKQLETGISSHPRFQALAGLDAFGHSARLNQFTGREINRRATINAKEAFATHFERFLTDTDYACRFPAMADYLSEILEHPINNGESPCRQNLTLFHLNQSSTIEIPFSRIYEIDFLWASEGKSSMSRFGHAMLRLVICAPNREYGADCRRDTRHHLVMNFVGVPEGIDLNVLRGLVGKFPLNLVVSSLTSVINEYNIHERRDLYSIPLALTLTQKQTLLRALQTTYWTHEGKYIFTNQNCTTEVVRHLSMITPELDQLLQLQTVRPDRLFAMLLKSDLNASRAKSRRELKKNVGSYFQSAEARFKEALVRTSLALGREIQTPEQYLEEVSVSEVKGLIENQKFDLVTYHAFSFLEAHRLRQAKVALMQASLQPERERVDQGVRRFNKVFRFYGMLLSNQNYGVPDAQELSTLVAEANAHAERLSPFLSELEKMISAAAQTAAEAVAESIALIQRLESLRRAETKTAATPET